MYKSVEVALWDALTVGSALVTTTLTTDPSVVTQSEVQRLQRKIAPTSQDGKRIHMAQEKWLSREKPNFLCRTDKHLWMTHPTCWPASWWTSFCSVNLPLQPTAANHFQRHILDLVVTCKVLTLKSLRTETMSSFFSFFPEFPTVSAQSWHWVTVRWTTHTQKSHSPTRTFYTSRGS